MPDGSGGHKPKLVPALKYKDAHRAVEWLQRAFGLEKHVVYPGDGGVVAHAELKVGDGFVMLGSKTAPDPNNPWADADMGLYVCVADVDAHYARAKAAGAEIVRELADTEYGSREYSARDTEGKLWSFGTYYPAPAGPR